MNLTIPITAKKKKKKIVMNKIMSQNGLGAPELCFRKIIFNDFS